MDMTNYAVATGMASSPWWLPILQNVSAGAAWLAPILGVIWLTVQIVAKIAEIRRPRNR